MICTFVALTTASMGAKAEINVEIPDTLNEVIVTATNNATSRNLIPYSVTTISQEQIEATGRTQLLSALSGRVPGLFVTERNIFGFGVSTGGSGGISIRGVGGSPTSQVLMMVDGKPQFAGVFSHPIADNYESEFVDHVEIVRGPSSVLYGSNAMGGAINIITRKPQQDGVSTVFKTQYGSYNTWQSSATNTIRKGKFASVLSMDYDRTDGVEKDFDFNQLSGYAKVCYDFNKNWSAYADYSIMKFKGNDPVYAKLWKGTDDIYHQDVTRGEASAVVTDEYDKTNGAIRVYFSHGNNKIEDPNPFQMYDNRIGILAYQNFQPLKMTQFTLGFDFDRYTGEVPMSGGVKRSDNVTPATMDKQGITEYAPYITLSQGIWNNIVVLNGGLRMSNSSMFNTQWLPQAGFTINPGQQWTIKANLAKGYRNPSFKELYLYMMANPDLKPENMMNYEITIGKQFSHLLSLELTGYISKGSNLIAIVFSKELNHQLNTNVGSFENKGLEVSVASSPIHNLDIHATYSVLKTNIVNLTGAPKHQYSLGADWRVNAKLSFNADMVGVSRLFVASDVKKQNYALLNLKANCQATDWLDVFVQGNNLTNAKYCINKGYTMPGTNVTGGIKVKL